MTMKAMVRPFSVLIIRVFLHFILFLQVGRAEMEVLRGEMGFVLIIMIPKLHL